ncbi:hypothetical protein B0H16DRAFT_1469968 [Mycena metata]|uniref:Uncharacterized protein n=1 Tax=Mycena metata TaxID=1033252 RepID=A0AAD7HW97_9AGAR|nr:hypothetical protein B0H16DRAFT_1469968 [Mycena metata]
MRIRLHSEKFQMAWEAWLRIAGGDELKVGWPKLRKEDIRCMQDAEELLRNAEKRRRANARWLRREEEYREDGLLPAVNEDEDDAMVTRGGENMREISWIWTLAGTAGTDEELEDALHIVWAKVWARSRWWTEEVRLLEEEWRRLPVTYAYRERQWLDRAVAVRVGEIPFEEAQGMIAYAVKHAQLYKKLAARAEERRTEEKLQSGKKRRVFQPSWDPIVGTEEGDAGAVSGAEEDDDADDDECGDIESNEELLMGGEVDKD